MRCKAIVCIATIAAVHADEAAANGSQDDPNVALVVVSSVAFAAVGLLDIATAPSSARRHNERLLSVVPWVDAGGEGIGLAFNLALPHPERVRRTTPERDTTLPATKSPNTALLWSLGATLVPSAIGFGMGTAAGWRDTEDATFAGLAVVGSGWLIGPSAGHWYAGRGGRGFATLGIRLGIAAFGMLAAADVFATSP